MRKIDGRCRRKWKKGKRVRSCRRILKDGDARHGGE